MLSTIKIILLGIIQGMTEFLPVSSSGHLVLGQHILGMDEPGVSLEIVLHLGTLLAVVAFYHDRISELFIPLFKSPKRYHKSQEFKILLALFFGTIPAALAGYFLDSYFEEFFSSPRYTAMFLIITGLILILPKIVNLKVGKKKINIFRGIIIGIAQALAIFPGISRSGTTITMARFLKIQPKKAAEFSFLLSIPAILGATVLKVGDAGTIPLDYLFGGIASAIIGYIAILIVIRILISEKFHYFGYYVILLGIIGLIFL
ncbi:MAG: undecaprenyl-diphosphate phosphatase [Candidatus Zixiibacteriota bacterium]